MKIVGVIPARWASTRFKGKVLAKIQGLPMIQHVWQRAKQSQLLDEVIIACDDERIFKAASDFKAKAVMTKPSHPSGTDRVIEAVENMEVDIIVNIQGDEPLVQPQVIDALAKALLDDQNVAVATVIKLITQEEEIANPNVVKIVVDHNKDALYFSRSPIPFNRDQKKGKEIPYYKHLGLYAYRKSFLKIFKNFKPSPLEQIEKLEQLRILEAGFKIRTVETPFESTGVDTKEDLQRVEALLKKGGRGG